ncbi:MAG: PHP domain-containing protein [Candidatus Omnitrophica bacterium]|jgi:hypothetical protein|nr:PHP domain-containing protein [Candidatus Omnitrophota bacterium]
MKFADLHLHTIFSDGTYTPEELVKASKKAGLSAISIADHDTVDAIIPSLKIAQKEDIEIIPGIELTAEHEGLEVHILGYCIDYTNKRLQEKLDFLGKNRRERIYKIVDKLAALDLKLDPEAVFEIASEGTVGRLHIARAMVKERIVKSTAEAFSRYIGDKCPAYVCGFRFSPAEAIGLIKEMGGVAILAHPYLIRNDELILEFVKQGVAGLEVYYPEHTQSMINYYLGLAKKHNLLVTGGSDCHGKAKPEVKIGMIKLPYELVEKLKEARRK